MVTRKPLLYYKGPSPHGKVVQYRCACCPDRAAAYEGMLPKGWSRLDINRARCRRCAKRGRR